MRFGYLTGSVVCAPRMLLPDSTSTTMMLASIRRTTSTVTALLSFRPSFSRRFRLSHPPTISSPSRRKWFKSSRPLTHIFPTKVKPEHQLDGNALIATPHDIASPLSPKRLRYLRTPASRCQIPHAFDDPSTAVFDIGPEARNSAGWTTHPSSLTNKELALRPPAFAIYVQQYLWNFGHRIHTLLFSELGELSSNPSTHSYIERDEGAGCVSC